MDIQQSFEHLVDHLAEANFFLAEAVELLERKLIARTMHKTRGNQTKASRLLGIHRNTLQKKMAQYKMTATSFRKKPVKGAPARKRKSEAA